MDDIVQNMDDENDNSAEREKKRQENKKLIDEVNEKIAEEEDRLLEIPKEIKEDNWLLHPPDSSPVLVAISFSLLAPDAIAAIME